VFGIEVDKGIVKPGYKLVNKKSGDSVGEIREIQSQGENVQEAKTGERVALSMNDVVIGKNVNEGDVLVTSLKDSDIEGLAQISKKLTIEERGLLKEMAEGNQ
jgi:translation initiation factor 5B